ncbi:MAG: sensor domain-containing diguanylate cyclase [Butyrivibrio sp.]|nr:sensor domain-containing diguanylate cyclase [Butyrivibrio sp.]
MENNKSNTLIQVIIFILALIATCGLVLCVFYNIYGISRRNLISNWESNVGQMASETDYYLSSPSHAVEFAAHEVDEMLNMGASNEDIKKYLEDQTSSYSAIIDNNPSGVYGYCNGEYLDGSGWIPPAGFDATSRPWYIAAREAKGAIVFTQPYLNLQTNTMMTSVCKVLKDPENVISMDIFLDGLQDMVADYINAKSIKSVIVMDDEGYIVSSSVKEEIGSCYPHSDDSFNSKVAQKVMTSDRASFEVFHDSYPCYIISRKLNIGWFIVFILDETEIFSSLKFIYLISAMILIAAIIIIFSVFMVFRHKIDEIEGLSREVWAIANIYSAVYDVDLKSDHARLVKCSRGFDELGIGNIDNYNFRIFELTADLVSPQSKDSLLQFLNPETYEERIGDLNSISHEFLDINGKWVRIQIVPLNRDSENKLYHLMITLESIDEAKKQQEHLIQLAETDNLTGIRNRNYGESSIRSIMSKGTPGMFILMDADHFKSVNDTYGHDVGDMVIVNLANCLKKTFRDSDVVFRLGGDEFAAFAPTVETLDVAQKIMDRLFNYVENISISQIQGRKICISVGATFFTAKEDDSFEFLYQRADKAMYKSKQTEGNTYNII